MADLLKLDIGCGQNKKDGFTGMDSAAADGVDIVHDANVFPWPFDDGSVDEVFCSHFLEHLTGDQRIPFMDELWRIMKDSAKATIITPFYSSSRAVQDPTHRWPPLCEASYLYFNKKWREDNKLTHYLGTCDFDFTCGYGLDGEVSLRAEDYQRYAVKHYINSVLDLQVVLTKRAAVDDVAN